jgi:hypothetical protein
MAVFPFPGPIAPETNPIITPQYYQPSVFPITAISYGTSTTVTTGTAFGVSNNYVVGQLVRFNIPFVFGAQQLTGQSGYVTQIPGPNQVTVNINTSKGYDPFNATPPRITTKPQIAAIGDVNSGGVGTQGRVNTPTTIPGSFINISPL